jgi:hypothetical protein
MPHIGLHAARCIYWFSEKKPQEVLCGMADEKRGRVCGEANYGVPHASLRSEKIGIQGFIDRTYYDRVGGSEVTRLARASFDR